MPSYKKLLAEFIGTAVLVVVAVGVATETFGFKLFGSELRRRRRRHGARLRPRAGGARLRHRPDLGLPRQPGGHDGVHLVGPHEADRGDRVHGSPRWPAASPGAYLLYWMITTSPLYHKSVQGLGTDGYGKALAPARQPGRRLPDRGRADGDLRDGRPLRHPQGGDPRRGRRGHRLRARDGAPHRHPADGDLGEPRPVVGPGPRRRAARR